MAQQSLSGNWHSYYRYPSSSRGNDALWGQHVLHSEQDGKKLRFESMPGSKSNVLIEVELSEDGRTAKGVWREESDPKGYYKGKVFDGTITFDITKNGERMNGIWRGEGGEGEMNSDIWELARIDTQKHPKGLPEYWQCTYWFPSNTFQGDEPSSYRMKLYNDADGTLILESLPNEIQAYMLVRLKREDSIAIGNWYETTSPTGEFKSAQYSGSGQLVVDPKTGSMEGMWAGAGYDRKKKQMRVYTGKWEIVPAEENQG